MKCSQCGKEFTLSYSARYQRIRSGRRTDICRLCLIHELEKDKGSNQQKHGWDNMKPDEREKRKKALSSHILNYMNRLSDEEKENRVHHIKESMKSYYQNLSKEERRQRSNRLNEYWKNLPKEEKECRIQKMRSARRQHKNSDDI